MLHNRVALLEQGSATYASIAGKDDDRAGTTTLVESMLQPVQQALDALAEEMLVVKAAVLAPAATKPAPEAAPDAVAAGAAAAADGGQVHQGAGNADLSEAAGGAGRLGATQDAAGTSSAVQPGTGSAEARMPASAEPSPSVPVGKPGGWWTSAGGAPGNAADAAEQPSLQLALAPLHERLAAAEAALHGLAHEHSAAVGAELDALAQSLAGLQSLMAQQAAQLDALMDGGAKPRRRRSSAGGSETSAGATLCGVPAQGGTQDLTGGTQAAAPGDATLPRAGARRTHSGLQARSWRQPPKHSEGTRRLRCKCIAHLSHLQPITCGFW